MIDGNTLFSARSAGVLAGSRSEKNKKNLAARKASVQGRQNKLTNPRR
jgi:hypothetical protein